MRSRFELMSMRQRWGSRDADPGRIVRDSAVTGAEGGTLGSDAVDWVKRRFLAREPLIRCPQAGCPGLIFTFKREIHHPGGTGSRILLRCTRGGSQHVLVVPMEPYTPDELEELKSGQARQDEPGCPRCGVRMVKEAAVAGAGRPAGGAMEAGGYSCPWCGVRWVVSSEWPSRGG